MALFQTSVLKTYLTQQDTSVVDRAYKKYTRYFHNATIQENIKNSNEEQYQAKFLDELFVNVLDYTLNPKPSFNLTTEFKNQTGAGKADGAILKDSKAIGVIELKGTNTKDLESIRKQAFDYKANQKGCVYVITSNFEKLRFYINDATEFLEFNLFQLAPKEFALLYLCLHKDNIVNNLPLTIKEASLVEEDKITKQFYNDYSVFKRELFRDLVKRNAKRLKTDTTTSVTSSDSQSESYREANENKALEKNVKLSLFKKSQKLIDRFLFIFFAEDRDLLPPNSTIQILDKWKADIDFGDERPLYNLFKQYFHFLDSGRKGTSLRAEIYAYNGGLFKPDSILDNLEIDDNLLYKHTYKLAKYDFSSQVDVNILGHIFENSLNEIESVNAEIEGGEFDKQKSKRKKDGVFYTPKYITKYIVENTVGKLCQEKKEELGFKEEAYFEVKRGTHQNTKKQLLEVLDTYRDWLLQITICDPACGSGAFLNQALDFLIKEHRYIDELKAKVLGGSIILSDIENTILENNIYGVDLNEESVEIAKLSLWLRTAQPRRKLNDLSNNIKCGNSLIDSKAVAGDKAFNWHTEFPQIFPPSKGDKGDVKQGLPAKASAKVGFDVVIGNPPYVPGKSLDNEFKKYVKNNYGLLIGKFDLYLLFLEKILSITAANSCWGVIIPNTVLVNENATLIRERLLKYKALSIVRLFRDDVFPDASVESVVLIVNNANEQINLVDEFGKEYGKVSLNTIKRDRFYRIQVSISESDQLILNKISTVSIALGELSDICIGIQIGGAGNSKDFKEKYISSTQETENHKKFLDGKDFEPYKISWSGNYVAYGDWLHRKRDDKYFLNDKILIRQIGATPVATIDKEKYYVLNTIYCLILNDRSNNLYSIETIYAFINSKLIKYYWRKMFSDNKTLFPKIKKSQLIEIPIKKNIPDNIRERIDKYVNANNIHFEYYYNIKSSFSKYIHSQLNEKLSRKLENWHELDFADFIKELNKAFKKAGGTPLTKKDEFEWLELFEDNRKKAQDLLTQIKQTEKEIDRLVYELYGLTEEERDFVENS